VAGGRVLLNAEDSPDGEQLQQCILSGAADSILGSRDVAKNTFREFVTFDVDQVYVEYVLFYRRVYNSRHESDAPVRRSSGTKVVEFDGFGVVGLEPIDEPATVRSPPACIIPDDVFVPGHIATEASCVPSGPAEMKCKAFEGETVGSSDEACYLMGSGDSASSTKTSIALDHGTYEAHVEVGDSIKSYSAPVHHAESSSDVSASTAADSSDGAYQSLGSGVYPFGKEGTVIAVPDRVCETCDVTESGVLPIGSTTSSSDRLLGSGEYASGKEGAVIALPDMIYDTHVAAESGLMPSVSATCSSDRLVGSGEYPSGKEGTVIALPDKIYDTHDASESGVLPPGRTTFSSDPCPDKTSIAVSRAFSLDEAPLGWSDRDAFLYKRPPSLDVFDSVSL
jgi:hypothetical protein